MMDVGIGAGERDNVDNQVYTAGQEAPAAHAWQSLGPMAQLALGYSAQPAPGRLWALLFSMMGGTDPQGRIFTMAYGG